MSIDEVFAGWFTDEFPPIFDSSFWLMLGVPLLSFVLVAFSTFAISKKFFKKAELHTVAMVFASIAFFISFGTGLWLEIKHSNNDVPELIAIAQQDETVQACQSVMNEVMDVDIAEYDFTDDEQRQVERLRAAQESYVFLGKHADGSKKVTVSGLADETFVVHQRSNGYYLDCYRVLEEAGVGSEFTQLVEEAYVIGGDLPERKGL